ncbi:hypothetical protein R1flu_003996 [Riccia fluitans]|uniref:Uncharacterized protein n=1 Tax=Riccia fluitans TaxID=41844 RepID=A0ABD1YS24_9MARC
MVATAAPQSCANAAAAAPQQSSLQSLSSTPTCSTSSLESRSLQITCRLTCGRRNVFELTRNQRGLGFGQASRFLEHVNSVRRPVLRRSSEKSNPKGGSATEDSIVPVSLANNDNLEGVIQVDRDSSDGPQPTWGRIYLLAGGDILFLLLFAAIGRMSHGLSGFDWDALRTADPFIAGWLLGSYFIGGYGPEGQGLKGLKVALLAAVKSWAVGIPLSLVIRGFTTGHVPPQPFIIVSLASTFVLQVGWRTAFTALFPNDEKAFQKKKGDRKGNPLEFFELLTSLVRRCDFLISRKLWLNRSYNCPTIIGCKVLLQFIPISASYVDAASDVKGDVKVREARESYGRDNPYAPDSHMFLTIHLQMMRLREFQTLDPASVPLRRQSYDFPPGHEFASGFFWPDSSGTLVDSE